MIAKQCSHKQIVANLFTAVLFLIICFPSQVFAFITLKTPGGNDFFYHDYYMPVKYRINSTGTPDVNTEISAVQLSFKTWEDVLSSRIAFKYAGLTNLRARYDNENIVVWVESNWTSETGTGSNVIALTTTIFSSSTGIIYDSDIEFNGEHWSWSDSGEPGKMDIQNIAVHEIGHFIGLDHVDDANYTGPETFSEATMYEFSSNGETKKRTLDQDDISGAAFIYPANASGPVYLSVTGVQNPLPPGFAADITVTAKDINGNTVTDYQGTVTFFSSDSAATLPANYTFLPEDNGTYTFLSSATLVTPGEHAITVNDVTDNSIAGSQVAITVSTNDPPLASDDFATVNEGQTVTVLDSLETSLLANDTDANGDTLAAVLVTGPVNSSGFTLNPDGTFTYTHDGSETTGDSFTYKANDGSSDSNEATVSIVISPVNDPPVIISQFPLNTPEDIPINILLSDLNVADPDNIYPTDFTLTVQDGVNYSRTGNTITPAPLFIGTLTVPVFVNDGTDNSNVYDLSVSVDPINDTPVVSDIPDQTIAEGGSFVAIALDDYVVDIDNPDAELTWSYSGNSELSVSIDAGRIATITIPNGDWFGSETITFTATDPGLLFDSDPVTFTVTNVNDAPTAVDDSATVGEDSGTTAIAVMANDSILPDTGETLSITAVTQGVNSGVVITGGGAGLTYAPNSNYFGSDSFTYTISDGNGGSDTATVNITVTSVNDVPVITGQAVISTAEETAVDIILADLTVDDPDNAYPTGFSLSVQDGANYSRSGNTITPTVDFNGPLTVPVVVNDGSDNSTPFDLTVTVNGVNDAPAVTDIPDQSIAEGGSFVTIALDSYVSDAESADTDLNWTFSGNSELSVSIDTARIATITTPHSDWFGSETITFTATDPGLLTDSDPVTFTVTNVNDAPTAANDSATVAEDSGATARAVLVNDSILPDTGEMLSITAVTQGTNGSVAITGGGTGLTYAPDSNYFGSDGFTYTISDGNGGSDTATVNITVTAVNDVPQITGQNAISTDEETAVEITLADLTVDDPDDAYPIGFSLSVQDGVGYGRSGNTITPTVDFNGPLTVPVVVNDGSHNSAPFDLTVTVNGVNDAPAVTDIPDQSIAEGGSFVTIALDSYVSDAESADTDLNWTFSGNSELSVSIDAARIATITIPDSDWFGSETITFTATDPGLLTDSDPVTFTVTNVNDAPTAANDSATVAEDSGAMAIAVLANDSILPDTGETLSITAVTQGTNGSVAITGGGTGLNYAPASNYFGSDSFTYTISDGNGGSDTATVNITVTAVNDIPVITGSVPLSTAEETALTITLADLTVDDADNTYPTGFSLSVQNGVNYSRTGNTITPAVDFDGLLTVPVVVNDGSDNSAPFDLTVTVNGVNDAPVVIDIPDQSIAEGGSFVTIALDSYVSDAESADTDLNWTFSGNSELGVSIDAARIATITIPDSDWFGSETITFTATDPGLLFDSDPVTFTVINVNDPPDAVSDTATVAEDSGVNPIAVLSNDSILPDVGETLLISNATQGTNGTVTITGGGTGLTYAPNSNYFGSDSFTYTISDGNGGSDTATVNITVTAVNDIPVITGAASLSTPEETALTITLVDLTVTDPDNTYPTGFSLSVQNGVNYSRTGNTITPVVDYNGTLTVPVIVNDGSDNSNVFDLAVTVNGVNDSPAVTDIPDQTIAEGGSFVTIALDSYVSDAESGDADLNWTYSGNNELGVSIDAARIATITIPNGDWFGSETITFTATDPGLLSDSDPVTFTVTNVNDAPTAAADSATVAEDSGATAIAVLANDSILPDTGETLSITAVTQGTNGSVAITGGGTGLTYAPASNYFGSDSFSYTISDGNGGSDTATVNITVTAVNDVPQITGQNVISTDEETAVEITLADLTVDDPDDAYPTGFSLSVQDGANYSRAGNTITPAVDYNGPLTVPVVVNDGSDNSAPFELTVTVNGINDTPAVTDIPDQSIAEGGSFVTIALDSFVSDAESGDADLNWTYSGNSELSVSIDAARIATITIPDSDWFGSETITFTATDPGLLSDSDPVTFTVTNVNDAPTAADDSATVAEDSGATAIAVLANDSILPDTGETLSITAVTQGVNGSVAITGGGTGLNYAPASNYFGSDSFTYTISDGNGGSDTATVNITVTAVNDAPVITGQAAVSTAEETAVTITLADLTVDDPDNTYPTGFSLNVQNGLNYSRTGNTITPAVDFNGSLTVPVVVNDGSDNSDPFDLIVTVGGVNDAPAVTDIPDQSIAEGGSFVTIALDSYVSDAESADTDLSWSFSGNSDLTVSIDINRIATITVPDADWFGSETVTFTATDPNLLSDSDPVIFTVTNVNDAPTAADDSATVVEDSDATAISVLANDSIAPDTGETLSIATVTQGTSGTVAITGGGTGLTYAPNSNYFGSDSFTYTISDGNGGSDTATVNISVTAVNDVPQITGQNAISTAEETAVTITFSDLTVVDPDDAYPTGFSLSVQDGINYSRTGNTITPAVDFNGTLTVPVVVNDGSDNSNVFDLAVTVGGVNDSPAVTDIPDQTIAEGGSFVTIVLDSYVSDAESVDADLSWSFSGNSELTVSIDVNRIVTIVAPNADWFGSETVTFTATDPGLLSDSDPVTFTVTNVNDAPTAADDSATVAEDSSASPIAVLANDSILPDAGETLLISNATQGTNGTVTITGGGTGLTYTPDSNYFGADSFTYTISDGNGGSDTATVNVTVTAVNDAPQITGQVAVSTAEETAVTITLSDLTVTDPDNTYPTGFSLSVQDGVNYSRTGNTITPAVDFNGTLTVPVVVNDGSDNSNTFDLAVTVSGVNDSPAVTDIPDQTIAEGGSFVTIALDNYVSDAESADADLGWSFSGNSELTVSIDINRIATIAAPNADWFGSETVTFTAADPNLLSDSDPVIFTVTNVNDAPTAADDSATVGEDSGAGAIAVLANDSIAPDVGETLSITAVTQGTNGAVAITGGGTGLTYAPSSNYFGADSFTYTISDGNGGSDSATVNLTVTAVNDAPQITGQNAISTDEETAVAISLADLTVTDADNTYPTGFSLSVQNGVNYSRTGNTITPAVDFNGTLTVPVVVNDGSDNSNTFDLIVTVGGVNDSPVLTDIPNQTIAEGSSFVTIALDGYVSDVDNADAELSWSYSGNSALSVSIDAGRIATITIPNADWFGSETITFTATDPGLQTGSDPVTFTVTNVNDAPTAADDSATVDEDSGAGAIAVLANDSILPDAGETLSITAVTQGINGSVVITGGGTGLTYAPDSNYFGSDTFTYTISDGNGGSDAATVNVTVTAVNDAPQITGQAALSTIEETAVAITLADLTVADPDNTYPTGFSLSVQDGVNYSRAGNTITPAVDFNGSLTVPVVVNDGSDNSDPFDLSVTVNGVNDGPAVADIPDQSIAEGGSFVTIALDSYVSDAESSDTSINWTFSGNTDLSVSIDAGRVATITIPNADWFGSETITFTATDPGLLSDSDPVTFTVTNVNDAPTAADDSASVAEDSGAGAIAVLANDSILPDSGETLSITAVTQGTNGSVAITGGGTGLTYAPNTDFFGSDSFTYTIADGNGGSDTATVDVTVTAVNDAPQITGQAALSTAEETAVTITFADLTVVDPDDGYPIGFSLSVQDGVNYGRSGNTITPTVDFNGTLTVPVIVNDGSDDSNLFDLAVTVGGVNDPPAVTDIPDQTIAEGGSFVTIALDNYVSDAESGDADLNWTFSGNTDLSVSIDAGRVATITIPNADWFGSETITFTATDPELLSDNDPVTFTVVNVNDAPTAAADSATVAEDSGATAFAVLANDSILPDVGETLSITAVTQGTNGSVVITGGGTGLTYTPGTDYAGSDSFTYTISDGNGGNDTATVNITITPVSDAPTVNDISFGLSEIASNGSIVGTVPASDPDVGDSLTFSITAGNDAGVFAIDAITGDLSLADNSTLDYEAISIYYLTVRVEDSELLNDTATITVNITDVNEIPTNITLSPATIDENQPSGSVVGTFTTEDPDLSDSHFYSLVTGAGDADNGSFVIVGSELQTAAAFDYESKNSYSIRVMADDQNSGTIVKQLTIGVNNVNEAPTITSTPAAVVDEDTAYLYNITATDGDAADTLTINASTKPAWLTLTDNGDGTATLSGTPEDNDVGANIVEITVTDIALATGTQNFTIMVNNINDPPVIISQLPLLTDEDNPLTLTLSDITVTDPDNIFPDDFSLSVYDGANYSRTNNTITPDINFYGLLTIPVTVNDGQADSAVYDLVVDIVPVNDAPVASADFLFTMANTDVSDTLSATDPDGDSLTYSIVSNGSLGTVNLTDPNSGAFTYTPNPSTTGIDTFTFKANDGVLDSNISTITITIDVIDTDRDGLSDSDEINIYGTDPNNADSDGDGFTDGQEVNAGYDPLAAESVPVTVYEDAEDGTTNGWTIYDASPAGATINNVFDSEHQSLVIELNGTGTYNGYWLQKDDNSPWQNNSQFALAWSMKFSEDYIIYVDILTSTGYKYLRYGPQDYDGLGSRMIHHGLGSYTADGTWRTFIRDLQADLSEAQPGDTLVEVNGIFVRGSGRFDDIKLMDVNWDSDSDGITDIAEINNYATAPSSSDTDGDGLGDNDEINLYGTDPNVPDTDNDGLQDKDELDFWGPDWNTDFDFDGLNNLVDPDADNDGVLDGDEFNLGFDPANRAQAPVSIYENAEDGLITRWDVYSGDPNGVTVDNLYDTDRQSRVIEVSMDGTQGIRLLRDDGNPWRNRGQFVLGWSMKSDSTFTIYVDIETSAGHRYMRYGPEDYDGHGTGEYVHFGLSSGITDNLWHDFVRDLQSDLNLAQPGVDIIEVNGFLFRGSGRLDDIQLMSNNVDVDVDGLTNISEVNSYATAPDNVDSDLDGISDSDEINIYSTVPNRADTDKDGLADGEKLNYWGVAWDTDFDSDGLNNLVDVDSDNDGVSDGKEISLGYDPSDQLYAPISIYEDAEDGSIAGWDVYDGNEAGVMIGNIFDVERQSQVVEINLDGYQGVRLRNADGTSWGNKGQFQLSWSIKTNEIFINYIDVQTSDGHRYLRYGPQDYNGLGDGEYIHHGLGSITTDGQWRTFTRDLQADLSEAQPNVTILSVDAFLIRGSVSVDDITLSLVD